MPNAVLDTSGRRRRGRSPCRTTTSSRRASRPRRSRRRSSSSDEIAGSSRRAGRSYGALEAYRLDDAERALVALGSTAGTVKDVVDELRDEGERVGLLKLLSFRPFPAARSRPHLVNAPASRCSTGPTRPAARHRCYAEIAAALYGAAAELDGHVYGLGGRDLHPPDVRAVFAGRPAPTSACEVSHVPSEDASCGTRTACRRCAAATRCARAAASPWSSAPC